MLPECLMNVCQRKFSVDNYKLENAPMVVRRSIQGTLKAFLKDFSIPTESWEQIAQDRTKWRGLIRKGAGEYKAKRIGEAKQKHAQLKARAKASPTELSSSDLSCSICNRQFRVRLVSSAILEHITQLIRIVHCQ